LRFDRILGVAMKGHEETVLLTAFPDLLGAVFVSHVDPDGEPDDAELGIGNVHAGEAFREESAHRLDVRRRRFLAPEIAPLEGTHVHAKPHPL
jgi:hypothetical protein